MHATHAPRTVPGAPNGIAVSGLVLLVATLLEVVAMAHHPTVATVDIAHAVRGIGDLSPLSGVVHGVLMALMLLSFFCLSTFAMRRGSTRALVRAGAIAYGSGTLVMFGAALVSGFVIGDVVTLTPHDTAVDLQINRQLLTLCGVRNQACARFAVVAMSAGIGLWSIDLLRDRGAARAIGILGCLVICVSIAALMSGWLRLDVAGMWTIVRLQGAWNQAIAASLLRDGRSRSE